VIRTENRTNVGQNAKRIRKLAIVVGAAPQRYRRLAVGQNRLHSRRAWRKICFWDGVVS